MDLTGISLSTLAPPLATFVLGIVSGGVIIPRLTAKKKILAWAVVSENEIISREVSEMLGVPVTITVGLETPSSLTAVTIKLGNSGNEVFENTTIAIRTNKDSKILNIRLRTSSEFEKRTKTEHKNNESSVTLDFLNPGQSVDAELLISNYTPNSTEIDAAAPGLKIRQQEATRWDLTASTAVLNILLSWLGVSIRSYPSPVNDVVSELRSLRGLLSDLIHTTKLPPSSPPVAKTNQLTTPGPIETRKTGPYVVTTRKGNDDI